MEITDLLTNDGYIIVNKLLIQEYGLEEAIIIGELSAEYNYYKERNELGEDNSFYSTVENVEKNTSLSQYQQSKAINHLKELGLVDVYYKGIPPKRYIKQSFIKLFDLYKSKNLTFKDEKTLSLKIKKLDTNSNNKIIINNNNKEVSKKISFDDLINNYTKNEELRQELKNHLATRKAKKATLTNRAIELSFKTLDKLANNDTDKLEIVRQSIERGWTGFFEVKKSIEQKNQEEMEKFLNEHK